MGRHVIIKASASNDDMLTAFEDKLAELASYSDDRLKQVSSSTGVKGAIVEISDADHSEKYTDPQHVFGYDDYYSLADFKDYWNRNYYWDDSLQEFNTFDEWWNETVKWLNPVSDEQSVTSSECIDDRCVKIYDEDYDDLYEDLDYVFGIDDNAVYSYADIKEYWNANNEGDPVLAEYPDFYTWWQDTGSFMRPVGF